jgi:hypothetical protein
MVVGMTVVCRPTVLSARSEGASAGPPKIGPGRATCHPKRRARPARSRRRGLRRSSREMSGALRYPRVHDNAIPNTRRSWGAISNQRHSVWQRGEMRSCLLKWLRRVATHVRRVRRRPVFAPRGWPVGHAEQQQTDLSSSGRSGETGRRAGLKSTNCHRKLLQVIVQYSIVALYKFCDCTL